MVRPGASSLREANADPPLNVMHPHIQTLPYQQYNARKLKAEWNTGEHQSGPRLR